MQSRTVNHKSSAFGWSNRTLIISLGGIFFLTFYPFRFAYPHAVLAHQSLFLLNGTKSAGTYDDFLNILLFAPFGFGMAERFRGKGKSWAITAALVAAAGALLSYCVEFTQLFIPNRDSGWHDILTNTTGALVGCILFALIGPIVVHLLSQGEIALKTFLTPRRSALMIPVYFALWIGISIPLQIQTRLSDWDPNSVLVVGNDSAGQAGASWKGQIFQIQFWNHAFSEKSGREITTGQLEDNFPYSPVAEYEFSGPPFRDHLGFLPDLSRTVQQLVRADPDEFAGSGVSGLTSQGPVANLVNDVTIQNQLTVRLVCKAASNSGVDAPIASISRGPRVTDFQIRQEDTDLVLWLRNPLTVRNPPLAWRIADVFSAGEIQDILFSYDGSVASIYLNGKAASRPYRLGPGAALASFFRTPRTKELDGYHDIYYVLVFFPGGILIGASFRYLTGSPAIRMVYIVLALMFSSLLFEWAMKFVSGRPVSIEYIILSLALAITGIIWLDSDGTHAMSSAAHNLL